LVLLAATLFTSGTISSEFEERTALILFTKPLRKWSIFLGKFLASYILGLIFMAVYYLVVAVVSLAVTGTVASELAMSMALSIAYLVGVNGLAILISSVSKKSSTAAILTFVTLLLIISIITNVLDMYNVDTWFMLDNAADHIYSCMTGESGSGTAAAVMLIWGITLFAGYSIFKKREF
jgi:ABC-2 type transport system permease protein